MTKTLITSQLKNPNINVQFQEVSRDYRTEIPNIVLEMLQHGLISPAAFILYSVYRRIAGQNGACWVGYRKLIEICHMSPRTFREARKFLTSHYDVLGGKSLVILTPGDKQLETADTVVITDIWHDNFSFFKNKLTCVKMCCTPGLKCAAPLGENVLQKKKPSKKEPNKKEPSSSSRASSSKPKAIDVKLNDDASGGDDDFGEKGKIPISNLAAEAGEVVVTKTNGIRLCMDQSAIYRYFISKPYNTDTVREAIKRMKNVEGPVNNILKYLESVCQSIEKEEVKAYKKPAQAKPVELNLPPDYTVPEAAPKKPRITWDELDREYKEKKKAEKNK